MTVARVLPDVTGLDKAFDYVVPPHLAGDAALGSIVRVPLHGRRVGGWIVELDPPDAGDRPDELKEIAKVTGLGPAPDVLELSEWAAWRWAGRRRHFLVAASPARAVTRLPAGRRTGARPEPTSAAAAKLLASGGGVLRLPPTISPLPAIRSAAALGPAVVVAPAVDAVRNIAGRLRAGGLSVAVVPDDWPTAAVGVDVVVGTRIAAWAPCPGLAGAVVVDEHDEALQAEASPTWHARDVLAERCLRVGAPLLLLSPAPSVAAVERWPVETLSHDRERAAWPIVEIVDRTGEAPWKRSLLTSRLIEVIRDPSLRVVCVLNTRGRARLLACRRCRELARCATCGAAVALDDSGRFACESCGTVRPMVCAACGATAFANLRPGVARLREELEAAAGRAVASVTGADDAGEVLDVAVVVGTEAALHRVPHADVVAFLDFDRELLAPRYRAAEEAMALLVRAARRVGRRDRGGRILVQTFLPQHGVLRAAVLADPGRLAADELARRRALALPPFAALAEVAGEGSDEFTGSLRGVDVGGADGHYLVRATSTEALADALAAGRRPAEARLRLSVDPLRV